MLALVFAFQWFGLVAALQAPLLTGSVVVTDPMVALAFATTRADARPADERAILEDMNAARRARGLGTLVLDERLSGLARSHARDMLLRRYVSHTTPEGESPYDRMREAGCAFAYAGENIALNADRPSAERALMESEAHRRNILDPHYVRVGIAAVATDGSELIVVQEFAG